MGNFRELKVWQLSKEIAVEIYKIIEVNQKLKKDYNLKDQLTRSAVSVPSNIAEGDELGTIKQAIKHFHIAKGSCAELITQLEIAKEIKFIETKTADDLINKSQIVSTMIRNLIKARSNFN